MQLSKRLKTVVNQVTKGNRVADVGCDHAYVSIYLTKHEIATKVIAMDINKGPLQRAAENIKKYQLTDKIETRQSDGVSSLTPGEADTILIGGMGGALTVKILSEGREVIEQCKELVLQPQSEIFLVREYLSENRFKIVFEDMLIEDDKYYVIMKAVKTSNTITLKKPVFDKYGEYLLKAKNPILKMYLEKELTTNTEMIKSLKSSSSEKAQERVKELLEEQQVIREGLVYYEM